MHCAEDGAAHFRQVIYRGLPAMSYPGLSAHRATRTPARA